MFHQDIKVDLSHLVLLAVIVMGVLFLTRKCSLQCGGNQEGLRIGNDSCGGGMVLPKACEAPCKCASCSEACYQRALSGQLPGCGGPNPNYDQCNLEYRKCLLFGCDVASANTCKCPQFYLQ